jgi:hypothetical protein
MVRQQTAPLALLVIFVLVNVSLVLGQSPPQLQIVMIGQGPGSYVVPAGQTSEVKLEILNTAPEDVYLIRGDVYLNPNLSGSWVEVHSESLGGFHLNFLESAIWTFNLEMPGKIQAANATNGLPQVVLLIQVTYLTGGGLQEAQQKQFVVSVPGASVSQPNALTWVAVVAVVIILVACVIAYRAYRKNQPAKSELKQHRRL